MVSAHKFQDVLVMEMNGFDLFMKAATVELEKYVTSPEIEPCERLGRYSHPGN